MDTKQIFTILSKDLIAKYVFQGVFAIDQMPNTLQNGSAYVVNTDESYEPGEHWVAIFVPSHTEAAEYFDSYGLPPLDKRLYKLFNSKSVYNKLQLQQNFSNACGFYCVYFILMRSRGISMDKIIYDLSRSDSDFVVKDFIFQNYKSLFV